MQLCRLPDIYHRVRAQVIHHHRVPVTVVRAIRATVKQVRNSNQYTQTHTYTKTHTHTSNWKYKRKLRIYTYIRKIYYVHSERKNLSEIRRHICVQKKHFFLIELIHLIYERKKQRQNAYIQNWNKHIQKHEFFSIR